MEKKNILESVQITKASFCRTLYLWVISRKTASQIRSVILIIFRFNFSFNLYSRWCTNSDQPRKMIQYAITRGDKLFIWRISNNIPLPPTSSLNHTIYMVIHILYSGLWYTYRYAYMYMLPARELKIKKIIWTVCWTVGYKNCKKFTTNTYNFSRNTKFYESFSSAYPHF